MTQALQQAVAYLSQRLPEDQQDQLALMLHRLKRIDSEYGLIFSPEPGIIEELDLNKKGLQEVREELGLK